MTSLCSFHQLRNGMHERKRFSLRVVQFTARLPVWPEVCFFVRLIYSDSRPLRVVSYDVSRSNLHSHCRPLFVATNLLALKLFHHCFLFFSFLAFRRNYTDKRHRWTRLLTEKQNAIVQNCGTTSSNASFKLCEYICTGCLKCFRSNDASIFFG